MGAPVWRERLADLLTRMAAARLKDEHPEWARAMLNERENLGDRDDALAWAFGCLRASWAATDAVQMLYPVVLIAGAGLMVGFEWFADQTLAAAVLLGALGLALGLISPRRVWLSALAVGLVVAGAVALERVTGVRPASEIYEHSLVSSLRWTILVAPALAATAVGSFAGRWLRA
jgi:hypothetical protein